MSSDEATPIDPMTAEAPARRRSSMANKLAQAAAFTAALVALGAVTAHASTITCGYGGAEGDPCGAYDFQTGSGGGGPFSGPAGRIFEFGSYTFDLHFLQLNGSFLLTVTDTLVSYPSGVAGLPPGVVCLPIADGSSNCVVFDVTGDGGPAPPPGPSTWDGTLGYEVYINWNAPTGGTFPGSTVRLFHDVDGGPTLYTDITLPGTYTDGGTGPGGCNVNPQPFCPGPGLLLSKAPGDPGLGGRDNSFSQFTVGVVPEPASLVLLGAGLIGLVYRLRRKRQPAEVAE